MYYTIYILYSAKRQVSSPTSNSVLPSAARLCIRPATVRELTLPSRAARRALQPHAASLDTGRAVDEKQMRNRGETQDIAQLPDCQTASQTGLPALHSSVRRCKFASDLYLWKGATSKWAQEHGS